MFRLMSIIARCLSRPAAHVLRRISVFSRSKNTSGHTQASTVLWTSFLGKSWSILESTINIRGGGGGGWWWKQSFEKLHIIKTRLFI